MKRTWVGYGLPRDWMDREQGEGHEFLHEATQVKTLGVDGGVKRVEIGDWRMEKGA